MLVRFLLVFSDDRSLLKNQFLKVKCKQVSDALVTASSEESVPTLSDLEAKVSPDFLKEAL